MIDLAAEEGAAATAVANHAAEELVRKEDAAAVANHLLSPASPTHSQEEEDLEEEDSEEEDSEDEDASGFVDIDDEDIAEDGLDEEEEEEESEDTSSSGGGPSGEWLIKK